MQERAGHMRLVEANWDTRNLGMATQELIIEKSDTVEAIQVQLDAMTGAYQVIRISELSTSVSMLLTSEKFVFSEQLSFWECTLGTPPASKFNRHLPKVETEVASQDDLLEVFHQIQLGLFNTDRVSRDPDFGVAVAGNRYVNWLNDEIQKGGAIYIIKFRQKASGFFCLRVVNQNPFVALSGIFPEAQVPGIGLSLQFEIQNKALEKGCMNLTTVVSTNNTAALRAHIAAGFLWKGTETIFTRKVKTATN